MKAIITVMPKRSVLDPQGEAVRQAIGHLNFPHVQTARIGKRIELQLPVDAQPEALRPELERISRDLLSNPVIEDYRLDFESE